MTCKDCLHYEACKGTYFTFKQMTDKDSFDKEHYADAYNCPDFTDQSNWVHLPCNEGDILYEITESKTINEHRVKAIRVELFGIFIDWDIIEGFIEKYITNVPASEIGRTIFLTREEAEKALERYK